MGAAVLKALAGSITAFALVFWLSAPGKSAPAASPLTTPESWTGEESLDLKGRRIAHWSSPRDPATETKNSADHFRSNGLEVGEAYEADSGGMITLVEGAQRLIINIVGSEEGSEITLMSGPLSKEVAP